MRLAINLLLIALVAFLIYLLYDSIKTPILFQNEKTKREQAVIAKLENIKQAQQVFRDIKGKFSNNFDSLRYVLTNDRLSDIIASGDPDDPSNVDLITYDTTYTAAIDVVKNRGIRLDSMEYVPFAKNNEKFKLQAMEITYQSTNNVPVILCGIKRSVFMGKFDESYSKYDDSYDPEKPMQFGDLSKPNLNGNWE